MHGYPHVHSHCTNPRSPTNVVYTSHFCRNLERGGRRIHLSPHLPLLLHTLCPTPAPGDVSLSLQHFCYGRQGVGGRLRATRTENLLDSTSNAPFLWRMMTPDHRSCLMPVLLQCSHPHGLMPKAETWGSSLKSPLRMPSQLSNLSCPFHLLRTQGNCPLHPIGLCFTRSWNCPQLLMCITSPVLRLQSHPYLLQSSSLL